MTAVEDAEDSTFPGLYRGVVRRTDDPQHKNRIVVTVPAINGDNPLDWALPCFPFVTKRRKVAVHGTATTSSGGDHPHTHSVSMDSTGQLSEDIMLRLPKPGEPVWVMFEHGDVDFPVWLGTWLP